MKQTFEQWMADADAIVEELSGVTSADLVDFDWRKAFDQGWSEARAARSALTESGW